MLCINLDKYGFKLLNWVNRKGSNRDYNVLPISRQLEIEDVEISGHEVLFIHYRVFAHIFFMCTYMCSGYCFYVVPDCLDFQTDHF